MVSRPVPGVGGVKMRVSSVATVGFLLGSAVAYGAVDVLPNIPPGSLVARLEVVASGLSGEINGTNQFFPTAMAALPDGRLLVMTLGGVVRVIDPVAGLLAAPYLDITNAATQIASGNFGMTAIAAHPGYGDPGSAGYGKIYVLETEVDGLTAPDFNDSLQQNAFGGAHHDVIVEYTADDPWASVFVGTRREILRVRQPGWDHNLFGFCFGVGAESDLMYIASGDGANASQGFPAIRQNPQTLSNVFGKILRIDPLGTNGVNGRYGVPDSNPFVGQVGVRAEIYSWGHRAPYRITADRETGAIWVGEVGQRNIEEVNLLSPGANYGWPLKEGSFLFNQLLFDDLQVDEDLDGNGTGDFADANGLTDPVFEYDHGSGLAVIGGFVYRGERWPLLRGRYVFGDFVRGGVLQSGFYHGDASGGPVSGQSGAVLEFRRDPGGSALPQSLIGIGEDREGELYLLGSLGGSGVVLRMVNGCPADLSEPAGVLDLADLNAFAGAFVSQHPSADLAAPRGVFDLADLAAFVGSFVGGCP